MTDSIYVIRANEEPVVLQVTEYTEEKDFQDLLERFPLLLSGELIDPASPRRWLFIGREVGVPDASEAAARWSLDHLFVDQDATPTLVEVKRQSDTRLRREVVGQMLDYAANAVKYWPAEILQERFTSTCTAKKKDPATVLREFLEGTETPVESFWQTVASRLATGDIRLIFFADRIGPELQRIVEFLNNQMRLTEVLAVEVRRYVGGDLETHIPRVMGLSASAELVKTSKASPRRKWTESEFLDAISPLPDPTAAGIKAALAFSKTPGWTSRFGTGMTGSLSVVRPLISSRSVVAFWATGDLSLQIGWLDSKNGEKPARAALRNELVEVGKSLFGLTPPLDLDSYYPTVSSDVWVQHADVLFTKLAAAASRVEATFQLTETE